MLVERPQGLSPDFLTEGSKLWAQQLAVHLETRRYPTYPSTIKAVWTLGHREPVVNSQRIWLGKTVAINIAHSRKTREENRSCGIDKLTSWDLEYFSPLYFFNGSDNENAQLRRLSTDKNWLVPKTKIIIADNFYPPNTIENGNRPKEHQNTQDQVTSFFQQITDRDSKLFRVDEVAIVSSSTHFVRIPFYLKYAEDMFAEKLAYPLTYYLYALPEKEEFAERLGEEKTKLAKWASKGHLAKTPSANLLAA